MKRIFSNVTSLLITLMLAGVSPAVLADNDHVEARRLLDSGEILSLEVILENVRQTHPGKIFEIELEREDGRIIYEAEILGENGIVEKIYIDARTGKLLTDREDD